MTFLASIGTGVVWNGLAYIAEHDYGFSKQQTLALYLVLGAMYVAGAFSTGRALSLFERWLSPRTALGMILGLETIVCMGPKIARGDWMLWLVGCAISVLSSWLWPIIESYLTAGRHGVRMRSAIGWWNLSWTGAVAIALILMAPLMKEHARMSIVLLGTLHAAALVPLMWFERFPGAHDHDQAQASIKSEYPFLLHAARMLLPLSYVLNAAMTPLLPYLMNNLGVDKTWQTPANSTWMFVRIAAMALMWRVGFWHGRWGTLLLGGLAMTIGFGLAVSGVSLAMLLVGLSVFGAGMGIVYYAALYYAMSVGRAKVDAGGTHEALIGVGYTIGPLSGFIGLEVSAQAQQWGWPVFNAWDGAGVVAVVWLLVALCAIAMLRPYLKAKRRRSEM